MTKSIFILLLGLAFISFACSSDDKFPEACEGGGNCDFETVTLEEGGMNIGGIAGAAGVVIAVGAAAGGGSGSSSGGDGSSDNNDSADSNTTAQNITINGVFALGQATSTDRHLFFRKIGNVVVYLFDNEGNEIAETITDNFGEYNFETVIDPDNFPVSVSISTEGNTYSSTVVTPTSEITSHVNEITTAIAHAFEERPNQTQANFDLVATQIVVEQFGVNEQGDSNIPAEIFVQGNEASLDSIVDPILEAAAENEVDLVEGNENLFTNETFLTDLSRQLQEVDNPDFSELFAINGNSTLDLIETLEELSEPDATDSQIENSIATLVEASEATQSQTDQTVAAIDVAIEEEDNNTTTSTTSTTTSTTTLPSIQTTTTTTTTSTTTTTTTSTTTTTTTTTTSTTHIVIIVPPTSTTTTTRIRPARPSVSNPEPASDSTVNPGRSGQILRVYAPDATSGEFYYDDDRNIDFFMEATRNGDYLEATIPYASQRMTNRGTNYWFVEATNSAGTTRYPANGTLSFTVGNTTNPPNSPPGSSTPTTTTTTTLSFNDLEFEPNDSMTTANSISFATTIEGYLDTDDDNDYYQVTVTRNGRLRLTLNPTSHSSLHLINSNNQTLRTRSGSSRLNIDYNVGPDTYYVRVTGNMSSSTYSLQVSGGVF